MGELTAAAPRIEQLIQPKCWRCLDTNIEMNLHGVAACSGCTGARETRSPAAWMLARKVFARVEAKREIDSLALSVARILTHFTSDTPLPRVLLEMHLRIDKRRLLLTIETIRHDWLLPVGSRKGQPSGYWIITTAAEFLEWHRSFRAQAVSEFATAYRLLRSNFPELAGQTSLDFVDAVKGELEEAIR